MKIGDLLNPLKNRRLSEAVTPARRTATEKQEGTESSPGVVSHISNTGKIMHKIDKLLNLGARDRFSISEFYKLTPQEQEEFIKMLSSLIKQGVIGYEVLENKDGVPEKHFIVNQIANRQTNGAPLWDEKESFPVRSDSTVIKDLLDQNHL